MQTDVIKKLYAMRLERNLSVYRLAELTGLNQSTLANTFSRGIVPSVSNLELLCEAMGVSLSEFFAREKDEEYRLNSAESRLIDNYRMLPPDTKELFIKLAESYNKRQ